MKSVRYLISVMLATFLWFDSLIGSFSGGVQVRSQPIPSLTVCPKGPPDCNFASIQQAIDIALPGDVIMIRAGTYEENLVIEKSLTLQGESTGTAVKIIGLKDGYSVIRIGSNDEAQVTLENLVVTRAKSGECQMPWSCPNVIWVRGPVKVSLNSLYISPNGSIGLVVTDSAQVSLGDFQISGSSWGLYLPDIARVSLTNSTVFDSHYDGIYVLGGQVNVIHSVISGNRGAGLSVSGSAQVSLINSQVSGNWEGLEIWGAPTVSLTNSQVSGNTRSGIVLNISGRVSLSGADVSGNGESGITVVGSHQVEIRDSRFLKNGKCGIGVFSAEAQVQGTANEMRGNGADLCGLAHTSLRKPLVPQTDKTQITVPGDFADLQEAVDAIAPGGTISVQMGSYDIGLTIWKPLSLKGAGRGQTVLRAAPGHQLVISILDQADIVQLQGLTVTGSTSVQGYGLLVYSGLTASDVQVAHNEGSGIDIRSKAQINLIRTQVFQNKGIAGVSVSAAQVSISDSTISFNGNFGLTVGSPRVTITNSTIANNGSDGLVTGSSITVNLINSRVSNNRGDGIYVPGSTHVSLSDSEVSDNGSTGLAVQPISSRARPVVWRYAQPSSRAMALPQIVRSPDLNPLKSVMALQCRANPR